MKSKYHFLKEKTIELRKGGQTYGEIREILKIPIPKSTLSHWCKNIKLSKSQKIRVKQKISKNAAKGRKAALETNKKKRVAYLKEVKKRISHLSTKIDNKDTAKIALAMLYLGEGNKDGNGLTFGNSNPIIIKIYLNLLRHCYNIDENKFRCTVQCRADQNTKKLELFWSKITAVPLKKFYKTRIDPRTIGKPSKKLDYKGVCRINYFSNDLFYEIKSIIEVIE
jgi:hypothetical protein